MSWQIRDLANDEHTLTVKAWNWLPTVLILETFGILDKDRLERMQYNVPVTVSEPEARAIADQLQNRVLPSIAAGGDDLRSLPQTGELTEDARHHYAATREWLGNFAGFCRTCGGFEIT